ncbi:protein O-GlcNAcase [Halalkalibacter kiskunsagensis]|uniref:Protein O-GlcNAcase n=1 Tax=Halalkalibacter kiskunsagensis TaxID=1548599 RepID=A0ABV6KJV7_9BACI
MNKSPFEIRGVIEGFYGVFYTTPERNDLIRFIGEQGYNFYIYGPKNDRQHRARWREPYPDFIMKQFSETIAIAKEVGVDFCYSIGSGVSINYASEEDFSYIQTKFQAFYDLGVRTFAITLDDIKSEFLHEEEKRAFRSYAHAHVELCNKLYDWLKTLDESCHLMLCPTDYHGTPPFSSYIYEIGNGLHPDIDIFYTGADITTPTISQLDAEEFANAVNRKPIIWDNYPVNDLAMTGEMHISPITGRDASLYKSSKGFVVNTMSQVEASKISLLTFADYFFDPINYQPWASWEKALLKIGGEDYVDDLKRFAENSLYSCLGHNEAKTLDLLTKATMDSLYEGEKATTSYAVQELYQYFDSLDEAGYQLKFRMGNYKLRNELIPWIQLMESWAWAGRRSIAVLRAVENNKDVKGPLNWLVENVNEIEQHPMRFAGTVVQPLIDYARKKAEVRKEEVYE